MRGVLTSEQSADSNCEAEITLPSRVHTALLPGDKRSPEPQHRRRVEAKPRTSAEVTLRCPDLITELTVSWVWGLKPPKYLGQKTASVHSVHHEPSAESLQ